MPVRSGWMCPQMTRKTQMLLFINPAVLRFRGRLRSKAHRIGKVGAHGAPYARNDPDRNSYAGIEHRHREERQRRGDRRPTRWRDISPGGEGLIYRRGAENAFFERNSGRKHQRFATKIAPAAHLNSRVIYRQKRKTLRLGVSAVDREGWCIRGQTSDAFRVGGAHGAPYAPHRCFQSRGQLALSLRSLRLCVEKETRANARPRARRQCHRGFHGAHRCP